MTQGANSATLPCLPTTSSVELLLHGEIEPRVKRNNPCVNTEPQEALAVVFIPSHHHLNLRLELGGCIEIAGLNFLPLTYEATCPGLPRTSQSVTDLLPGFWCFLFYSGRCDLCTVYI